MQARQDIVALMDQPNADLVRAALLLEREEHPNIDPTHVLSSVQHWAKIIDERLGGARAPRALAERFADLLFGELGFRGNDKEYYDPDNSYLSRVVERRVGIPVSLSLLYLGIGRELRAPVRPIGFPGHFLVQMGDGDRSLLVDPFGEGRVLSQESLVALLRRTQGPDVSLQPDMLRTLPPRATLARMQRNLKAIFMRSSEWERALAACERLVFLLPEAPDERRDRGMVYEQLGCFKAATNDYQRYLEMQPDAPDSSNIHNRWLETTQRVAMLH